MDLGADLFRESEWEIQRRKEAESFAECQRNRSWGIRHRDAAGQIVIRGKTLSFIEGIGQQMRVWDCALVLAKFLDIHFEKGFFRGKSVLEVGCGLGVPGMAASVLGATVLLTDRVSIQVSF